MIKLKNRKKQDNFMLYIPKRKHTSWEKDKDQVKLIFYHDKLAERFIRWLVKKPTVSDITLDAIGSTVWELIDGNSSVNDISKQLYERYGERCNPSNNSLILFLRHLNRKGWISFDRGEQE